MDNQAKLGTYCVRPDAANAEARMGSETHLNRFKPISTDINRFKPVGWWGVAVKYQVNFYHERCERHEMAARELKDRKEPELEDSAIKVNQGSRNWRGTTEYDGAQGTAAPYQPTFLLVVLDHGQSRLIPPSPRGFGATSKVWAKLKMAGLLAVAAETMAALARVPLRGFGAVASGFTLVFNALN